VKCTNEKCKKKAKLQTVKTFDSATETHRIKRCPSCKMRFSTVELHETTLKTIHLNYRNEISELDGKKEVAILEVEHVRGVIRSFLDLAELVNPVSGRKRC